MGGSAVRKRNRLNLGIFPFINAIGRMWQKREIALQNQIISVPGGHLDHF
jgi:hypothetical protein